MEIVTAQPQEATLRPAAVDRTEALDRAAVTDGTLKTSAAYTADSTLAVEVLSRGIR